MIRIMKMISGAVVATVLALSSWVSAAQGDGTYAPKSKGNIVLDTAYRWRVHITMRTPVVSDQKGAVGPLDTKDLSPRDRVVVFSSDSPPEAWTKVDFDDGAWPRARGPFDLMPGGRPFGNPYHAHHFARFSLRGTFRVEDPNRASGLKLSLSYRGGAVVYLNGKEIARGHMAEGEPDADTLAVAYPQEVFVDAKGKPVPAVSCCKKNTDPLQRAVKRVRRLENVSIPSSALRKGVNVLAVALYRAPLSGPHLRGTRDSKTLWTQLGFLGLSLTAPDAAMVTPGGSAPRRIRVFNSDGPLGLYEIDFFDPWEPLRPLELMVVRNAAVSGKVVLCSPDPMRGVEVHISDLTLPNGPSIPASALEIRYARPDLLIGKNRRSRVSRFDALVNDSPDETPVSARTGVALLPVWLTIHVPKDTSAGRYTGVLRLKAQDMSEVEVPVGLQVWDVTLPDINGYASYVGLVQSPDSLALAYKLTPWDEKHWQFIAESFRLMKGVGNDCVIIPLVQRTFYGNEESMVRWIRKKDGSLVHDLKRLERYLDCAIKGFGSPRIVCLCLWEPVNAYANAGPDGKGMDMEITVSDLSGQVGTASVPEWGTPASLSFWKPVFDDIRTMLAARGLEQAMCVGTATQAPPGKVVLSDMDAIAPGIKWFAIRHEWWKQMGGRDTAISVGVYGSPRRTGVGKDYTYVWQDPRLWAVWPRTSVCNVDDVSSPALYRVFMDRTMMAGISGIGNMGADFWPVVPAGRGRVRPVLRSNWAQLGLGARGTPARLLAQGSAGPVGTIRLEMLREGVQDAEVRVLIEKALMDDAKKAKLGAAWEKQARDVLDRYTQITLMVRPGNGKGSRGTFHESLIWYAGVLRLQRTALYAVAAQMQK